MALGSRIVGFGLVLALCAGPAMAADHVAGSNEKGFARLSFTLDTPAKLSASATGSVLTIGLDRAASVAPAAIVAAFPSLIASGHADADGKTLRFALSQPVKLHVSQQGTRAVVDLAPADFTGAMPDLPPPAKAAAPKPVDPASLPLIKLRAGGYSNFTRLVFDWPKDTPYTVFPGAGKIGIRFAVPARMDLSMVSKFPPAWVKNASWRQDGNATLVEFDTDADAGYHDFRDGTHVVLDILAPKADATSYAPPGLSKDAKPVITKLAPVGKDLSKEQAKAVTDAAAALAPKKPDAKAETKPADTKAAEAKPAPDVKTPDAKPADTKTATADPAAIPSASAFVSANGANLTFRGAAGKPAAIFIRGLTAWVVLESAAPFDTAALKGLNGFAAAVEANTGPGTAILRITLKAPAQIGAHVSGNDLKVAIAASVGDVPTAIGFARNQTDPRRTSLTTLVPLSDKTLALNDPATGDVLTVVPSAIGFGMPQQKVFAAFAALPSAAGLVIAPYTDDLSVSVADARVTIARPDGMALTPPQLPVAGSPAALAHMAGGPSYLDFAKWGQMVGGSVLATERALNHDMAVMPASQLNNARLRLARFYLAQGLGAESLGLINLMQDSDPALKGDVQLATMRAAADYMMGRYRDGHNELAGPVFDADRHAAFWRGLLDAAQENWKDAHAELDAADPVLARYPQDWQIKAHLADAEAALNLGRLDLADAALLRLPKTLAPSQDLEARLARARIAAAESRYDSAAPEFTAVEKGGDERLAVRAIYYHTEAGLNAGAISAKQAIDTLERLRFRWRGDGLELKTLRKLASLYFKANQWRNGLKTLRVATQDFSGDASRAAQDDMRGAFVNLYLKGGADKLTPVESLALFYDNLDLTPIGPDGDEMIRRMSDRLIAADLLDPAITLLSYQVDKRLDGIAKAQVATRLAAAQVMDAKPADAITSLRNSEITGLPDDIIHARLILEARAFAALKQYDNALDLIGVDNAEDTRRLRADIYWESGNWAVAGQKSEEFLGTRAADAAPLTAQDRADVLRAAVAYSLANDEKSLERIAASFGPKMKGTADGTIFAVLTQPIDLHGLAFRDAAAKIASVDTLKTFLQDFNKKFSAPAKAS